MDVAGHVVGAKFARDALGPDAGLVAFAPFEAQRADAPLLLAVLNAAEGWAVGRLGQHVGKVFLDAVGCRFVAFDAQLDRDCLDRAVFGQNGDCGHDGVDAAGHPLPLGFLALLPGFGVDDGDA